MSTSAGAVPRTLADQLRGWSDTQLTQLLTERPDLFAPTPQDSSQLASRAATRASVQRAVDQLTTLELTVVDAVLAVGGTTSTTALRRLVNAAEEQVDTAVARLRALALLWGEDESLRAVSVLHDLIGTGTSGLGPSVTALLSGHGPSRVHALARELGLTPSGDRHSDVAAVAARLSDCDVVSRLVEGVGERARAILAHLDQENREGMVESTERSTQHGNDLGPVDQLLAVGLLVARDRRHVAVPREVSICLRGGCTTHEPVDEVPALATAARSQELVDRTAAGAAAELVRHVDLLLEAWGTAPPTALRSGGLAVRDLKAAAALLLTDERTAALHVEVARAAGLVDTGETPDGEPVWLPTEAFDLWQAASVPQRWTRLATAWLETPRLLGLIGSRDASAFTAPATNQRPRTVNALMPDLERGWLPETRWTALHEIADLEPGTVLAAGTGVASLVDRMAWLRPRRPAARAQAVGWVVEESAVLGITALGGLSSHGRALLGEGDQAVADALAPLLPEPVDHVLLQADLTAVAPGPLEPELARTLAVLADIESRGGATVYRFTEGSVRRGFDSGWSAAEVHDFLSTGSRTPVPQALSYLVDDVARKFGTIRVGAASAFLRSDDETALAALVHDPAARGLRLRLLAPTVVVSDVPVDVLLPRLRELGTAPVVEGPDGTVRVVRRESLRAAVHTPRQREDAGGRAAARTAARVAATVTAVRAGDLAASNRPEPALAAGTPTAPAATLALLREAVEARQSVWLAYVDSHGSTVERVVEPVSVDAGWLSAYDHRTEDVRSFAVHRITAVRRLDDRPDSG